MDLNILLHIFGKRLFCDGCTWYKVVTLIQLSRFGTISIWADSSNWFGLWILHKTIILQFLICTFEIFRYCRKQVLCNKTSLFCCIICIMYLRLETWRGIHLKCKNCNQKSSGSFAFSPINMFCVMQSTSKTVNFWGEI